ncbi:hypothetical protein [Prosthecobacter fluviatilis]|uniref:Uncharacterized protein n=1 Tax=Prosthecobacter fluviatilis TaxID=445931 RepID=A0ABW0KXE2_9BACT
MSPIQTLIYEKVRGSGCLNAAELAAFQTFSENWERRLKLDLLDFRWTESVPDHVIQARICGVTTHRLPEVGGSRGAAGLGIACLLSGLLGLSALPGQWAVWLGLCAAGLGVLVLWSARRDPQGRQAYEEARRSYLAERQALLRELPKELRPANRVCLHCTRPIT